MSAERRRPPPHFKLESAPSARILSSSRSLQSTSSHSSTRTSLCAEGGDFSPSPSLRNSWSFNNNDDRPTNNNDTNNLRRQVCRSQSTTAILTISEPGDGKRGRLTFTTSTENLKRAGSSRSMSSRSSLSSPGDEGSFSGAPLPPRPERVVLPFDDE